MGRGKSDRGGRRDDVRQVGEETEKQVDGGDFYVFNTEDKDKGNLSQGVKLIYLNVIKKFMLMR